jgi:hypothetical protein
MMRKFLVLLFALLLSIGIASAQIMNIPTAGVAKVENSKDVKYYEGDYSFSLDPDRNTVYITSHTGKCFPLTGQYKVEYLQQIYDVEMGKAYTFALSRNNVRYVMTMSNTIISFSKAGDNSVIWHFYTTKSIGL